jgi:hypothetical protein
LGSAKDKIAKRGGKGFAPLVLPNREPAVSSSPSQPDPLQKLLDDAENELRRRLEEACESEAKGVSNESTEEVRRLEDNLLAAALAAKQTIAVRSHMKRPTDVERERPVKIDVAPHRDTQAGAPGKVEPGSTVNERGEKSAMGVREFTDDEGRSWRAWPVVPGLSKASSSGRQFLGDFQSGWICFEGLSTSARRRLPYLSANWPEITDEELKRLIQQAIDAPVRGKRAW